MIRLDPAEPALNRLQRRALAAGALGLLAWGIGTYQAPRGGFAGYLWVYLFGLGLALGALGWLMIHHLVGGRWGVVIRRPLEAAAGTLRTWAVLFLPLASGAPFLYPWADPALAPNAAVPLAHQAAYMNGPALLARAAVYWGCWLWLAASLRRWSFEEDAAGARASGPLHAFAAPGLIALFLTVSFAMVDGLMALEPLWYSTLFGLLVIAGQFVAAMALALACLAAFSRDARHRQALTGQVLNDLGNLTLAAVMLWAYLAFSQYLIVWSGNLPREAIWYVQRTRGGWPALALAVALLAFALPFFALLFKPLKRDPRGLALVAGLLLVAQALNTLWMVLPSVRGPSWVDAAAFLGLGGVWLASFVQALKAAPLLPLQPAVLSREAPHAG